MTPHRILTMVCGQPPVAIAATHGDYLKWFQDAMGAQVELVPWYVQERKDEPTLTDFSGMVVTGAPASLTKPEPWMENAIELIRQASETAVPVLGVCFGHQLVGCAFGAPTVPASGDGEHGSLDITLSATGKADPLFASMPERFSAQLTHYDQVDPQAVSFTNGLRVLASSDGCPVQALAAGDHIRSVQYHPEFSMDIMQTYLDERDGAPRARECGTASNVFQNWIDHWIAGEPH